MSQTNVYSHARIRRGGSEGDLTYHPIQHASAATKLHSTKSVTLHNTTTTSIETLKSVLVLVGCLLIGAWGLWVLALTVATWPPKASSSSSQVHVAIADTTFLWRLRRPVAAAPAPTSAATTLVLYVYSGSSDPACLDNLRYFVRTAVKEDDGVEYVFAVQLDPGEVLDVVALPRLPRNARYVGHRNACYDWGTFGELLHSGEINASAYTHFILINSSVRGPFLPTYATMHWSQPLISKLRGPVKLVGPTISCEGQAQGPGGLPGRTNPHVQSYVVAMDYEALTILQSDNATLQCFDTMMDVIYHSELGSSAVLFDRGYSIDCLMTRYQGVDWRNREYWNCNAGLNPYVASQYDGISLHPYEVLFVKVKDFMLQQQWSTATSAVKYDAWSNPWVHRDVSTNDHAQAAPILRAPQVWLMQQRNSSCFDSGFYRMRSPDLVSLPDAAALWEHFVQHGQFEGRPWRLLCSRQQWDTLTDTVTTIATTVPAADMETNKPNNPLPTNHTARTLAHTAATPDRDTPVPRNGDDHDVDAQDTMPLFGAPWVNRGGRFGATLHVAA